MNIVIVTVIFIPSLPIYSGIFYIKHYQGSHTYLQIPTFPARTQKTSEFEEQDQIFHWLLTLTGVFEKLKISLSKKGRLN